MDRSGLPIDTALPALRAALALGDSAVLSAPPGAGKSTVVPLVLLREAWARGKRILMLEPRRLAARAVAQRMAHSLDEPVGRTVGYRMRRDTLVSRHTRIEVVTEGVLTRMLQSDPALEGVAAVIFDEFHERSLQADLGLALALDARATLAPELRILVMSATLEAESVAALLGAAPLVVAHGRSFPVETRYVGEGAPPLPQPARQGQGVERTVVRVILRALRETQGDVLVFLPGAAEIRQVGTLLESAGAAARILPLYGDLSPEAQQAALTPVAGSRRIVLATNIAETSLTLEGVRVVVDSGLVRRLRFDPVTGMSRLELVRISRASADQRQGRAGRLGPGVCYRLWSEAAHRSLAPFTPPQITEADLAPLALELAGWGVRDAATLKWLDPPPPALLASARDLLGRLGALDDDGRITRHGRDMARLSVHPRVAHMLLRARELGALALAAELAAVLSERDLLGGLPGRDADIRTRLEVLRGRGGPGAANPAAWHAVRESARELIRQMERADSSGNEAHAQVSAGALLALAYPDRIGLRRGTAGGHYTLANGRGAQFAQPQSLARQDLIVAVDLDDRDRDARILLAAPLERAALETLYGDRLIWQHTVEWSRLEQAVLARRELRFGQLLLETRPWPEVSAERVCEAMLTGVRELGLAALPWDRETRDLQARTAFVRRLDGGEDWPDLSDEALAADLSGWLAPWLEGLTRRDHLARVPLAQALRARLGWDRERALDSLAPTHLTVPSGSRIRIDYLDDSAPAVAVRLQEVFGLATTPRLGNGRVPITFKLLSPAHRPVQVTRDLESFWARGYAQVRKDLRGRYPKHHWPDDPLRAEPVRGVRRGR
ncbi:MAG: ATP-dependent helicase HrpB [Steroidobacteraceae bacterium]